MPERAGLQPRSVRLSYDLVCQGSGLDIPTEFPHTERRVRSFAYLDKGGGGIRATKPSETPGSSFAVHVADTRAAFDKALLEGAEEMVPPTRVMEGVTIAVVRAPGGVPIGFSGP